jgi:tetratricopeptide (TPR) repeat protein/DNA-binding CsgD family transcriptional regulator
MKLAISKFHRICFIFLLGTSFTLNAFGAIDNRDSLQNKYLVTTKLSEKISILNLLAESYINENPVMALNFAMQARSLAKSSDNLLEESKAVYFMAVANYRQENYLIAYNLIAESQEGFKKVKNTFWYANSCLEMGKTNERLFEFEKALESLMQALELFKELGDLVKQAETFNIIGINYFDQKEYDKAFINFEQAMKIRLRLNDEAGLSSIYNNIGEIYRFKNDFLPALSFFKKAIKNNIALTRPKSLAINYDNIGNIFIIQGKYDSALYYLNESHRISKSRHDDELISLCYISKGKLFKKLSQVNEALQYFDSGYQIARSKGYLIQIQDAAFELSELYKDINQFNQAFQYHKIYKEAGDSLFDTRNEEKIAQIEMNLIFDHENKVIELQQEKTRVQYYILVLGLISLVFIFFLSYGRLRIKINQSKIKHDNLLLESQQLKKDIEFKDRELATNVMYLVKKNELINYISEKLLKAKSIFKKERQDAVQEIVLELQSNIDSDIWKTFEERFKAVHKEFYQKLHSNYPQLSENDKKLCALLRLNLSTKDIAAITHQNPNSIDVARTRLRKKLNISNTEISLVSFLESF